MPRWPVLLLPALALLVGCSELDHTRQCRSLAKFVNRRLDEISTLSQNGADRQSYARVADAYDTLGRDLARLPITDPKLKADVPEVAKVFTRAAGAARRAARGVARHDEPMLEQAQREFEHIDQRHKALVRKLDGTCR